MIIVEIYIEEADVELLVKAKREFVKVANKLGLDVFGSNIQTKDVYDEEIF